MATVLVVDDEPSIVWAFERFLQQLGHRVRSAATAERALELAAEQAPDLVILDVKLPGMDGLAALAELRRLHPDLPAIVITAHGTLDTAVRAVKLGAVEYLSKPLDLARARQVFEAALSRAPTNREVEALRAEVGPGFAPIVGKSPAMQAVFAKIAAVCAGDATVLLVGESGTGKELLARAIHANGPRAGGPFEPVNCGSIPETLLESELFGHEKGAFTGAIRLKPGRVELARGGTLFLDEVGELAPATQVKLLRFLEDRSFQRVGGTEKLAADVRIVAATNADLKARVAAGTFREDLYFRLDVVKVEVPPLRARKEDLPLLVAHFVQHAKAEGISDEALRILRAHAWPGNVRELKNAIEHGAVLARGRAIRPEHLPPTVVNPGAPAGGDPDARIAAIVAQLAADPALPAGEVFRGVGLRWERELLKLALERTGGNQVKASEWLGINRLTLRNKLRQHGLHD